MVLATRCPHCETVFRVQDAQLARTRGRVRCGQCNEVFDALQNLLDPSAASTIDFGASDHGRKQDGPIAASAAERAPLDRVNGEPRAFMAPAAQRAASEKASPEKSAPPVQAAPATFADLLADELREPTLAPPSMEAPPEAAPHEPGATRAPSPNVPETPRTAKERAPSSPPSQPLTPAATNAPPESERTRSAPAASPTAASPAAPAPAASASAARTAATERERAASAADSRPRPRAEDDEEPKLSLGDAPSATWRAEREPREPRFSEPPSTEARVPPRSPAAGAEMPPPAAQAEERPRPFEVTREPRTGAPRHTWLRVVGAFVSLVLVVLLVAQLTWWRRETVMVYWPSSQSLFAEACTYLGCQISPPRDIDGLQVEASDLRQIDGPHRLELRVPLRNRYNVALAYPAIELTLFDDKNEVAIRRVLWPQEYVPPGTPIAAGLPPHSAQTMIVRLDSGNAVATNFRVQIFYP